MIKISGVYTALCTPIIENKVCESALDKLINHVLSNGCKGLVALGGTGEYCGLSHQQRIDTVKMTIAANKKRVPVIAGIIGPGLPEAIEMGNKCRELGADAIMVVTPYYVIANQHGIKDYYQLLMKEVALPIVLYNIPYRTSVNMMPETVERLLDDDKSGQIVAIKECTPNMGQALDLLSRVKDRISFLCGEEYLFLTEVSCGAAGAILASSNLVPQIWNDMFDSVKAGNLKRAEEILLHITPLLRQVFAESNPGPLKHAMKMIGIDCGYALNPLTNVSDEVVKKLEIELNNLLKWYSSKYIVKN